MECADRNEINTLLLDFNIKYIFQMKSDWK